MIARKLLEACAVPVIGSDSGEKKRRDQGQGGLELANARYAWPVIARDYLAFFERL